jgi:mannose-1-phosphate guanylyltransferase
MRALLLAAGKGTRLRPLTDTVPKCLVPIHGRPLLAYWLDLLFSDGIERALITTHWLPEQVRGFVATSP